MTMKHISEQIGYLRLDHRMTTDQHIKKTNTSISNNEK